MDLRTQTHAQASSAAAGSSNADRLAGTAASTVHDVMEKVGSAVGETADKVKQAAARLPRDSRDAVYGAVHAATTAAGTLADKVEDLKQKQQHLLQTTTDYVSANPLKSVGFAFVAGWLFAHITR